MDNDTHTFRFVRSPFDPFKVSIQRRTRVFFGLIPSWEWVCGYGDSFIDFDGGSHYVAADFADIDAAKNSLDHLVEHDGMLFVKNAF